MRLARTLRLLGLTLPLLLAACGAAPAAPASSPATAAPEDAIARVNAIADLVLADYFEESPESATSLRIPGATFDRLPDDSIAGVRAREDRREGWLGELRAMDRRALTGTAARAYDVAIEMLAAKSGTRVCRNELWTVSQTVTGWQIRFAQLAAIQPVGTDPFRAQALARFSALPAYVDAQIANLREGLRVGYTAAAVNVREVMEQLDTLLATAPDRSPFYSPAARDGSADFQAKFRALVADRIAPAAKRYRVFLEEEYLPRARAAVGVSANPNGAACYRAALRLYSTLDVDPKDVHARGLALIADLEAEMKALSAKSFGGADLPTLLERFKSDPQYRYKDRDEVISQARAAIQRAHDAMPRAFHLLPKDDVGVEPIPAFEEKMASAHYLSAALDGSRPGAYYIRLYQPEKQSKMLGEDVAFHEAIPGHHLQVDIAHRLDGIPGVSRYVYIAGYHEGWGLYAERVADELGLYSSDADRFGMLTGAMHRAVRMVVDTGIHALEWDRQKAIDTVLAHTSFSLDRATAEIDRYIAWPGQAPSYMIGCLEIMALRLEATRALGDRFDLREFHDRVLESGGVPLPVLRANVERWIVAKKG